MIVIRALIQYNPIALINDLWGNRDLIRQLVIRDLAQKYRGSFLGILWSFINPLFLLLVYSFVFSVVFKSRWQGQGDSASLGQFALILFAGLTPFNLFSETTNRAPGLILATPNFVKKVVFPLEVLPVVSIGTALIQSAISLGLIISAKLIIEGDLAPTLIFLPLEYIPLILLSMGFCWFLSSLGIYIRDISQLIGLVTQILFYASPVFYPVTAIPERFRFLYSLNPLTHIITSFRQLILWNEFFPFGEWAMWVFVSALIAWIGYIWFMKSKNGFADVM